MVINSTQPREIKAVPMSLSDVSEDGWFEGYACLFDKEDLGRDVIRPGAFQRSLSKRGVQNIKLLYQHDPAQPLGHWDTIREDGKGLFVRGRLATEVEKARETLSMMKAGILDGLSIGFRTVRGHRDAKTGVRHLIELDLWEISIVTFPMQPEARISAVKSCALQAAQDPDCTQTITKREMERKLMQDAGLSRSQARALMMHGYSGLNGKQDAALISPPHPLMGLRRLTQAMCQATLTSSSVQSVQTD